MSLLEQCQRWNENDEFQKIIDALEDIPAGERTPEMDSELARAYSNLAEPGIGSCSRSLLICWNATKNISRATTAGISAWAMPITI